MKIEIDVSMDYELGGDPMVLLTIETAQTEGQRVLSHELTADGAEISHVDGEFGIGQRTWGRFAPDRMQLRYKADVEVTRPNVVLEDLPPTPLHDHPGETLALLRPSRFCQSDMFPAFVARRFGHLSGGAKIAAIRDWVFREMAYVPASSTTATTVLDTFAAREGICRDYAHMVCALARAAQIPARYAAVYGPGVEPPDFHAVAQVWLDGGWHLVDATGMCDPDEMVIIAVGRDACDTAFMETDLPAQMRSQSVQVRRAG